ncbi:hypothetical protein DFJ73DRAFT_115143 [Zopfochytrium polystomum]|nr:hypothetical protein DFJ73DRAFT_115143 [Zopfochytrium polystomum]
MDNHYIRPQSAAPSLQKFTSATAPSRALALPTSLLRVSRAMHAAAISVLYGENVIGIAPFTDAFDGLAPAAARAIRHVLVNMPEPDLEIGETAASLELKYAASFSTFCRVIRERLSPHDLDMHLRLCFKKASCSAFRAAVRDAGTAPPMVKSCAVMTLSPKGRSANSKGESRAIAGFMTSGAPIIEAESTAVRPADSFPIMRLPHHVRKEILRYSGLLWRWEPTFYKEQLYIRQGKLDCVKYTRRTLLDWGDCQNAGAGIEYEEEDASSRPRPGWTIVGNPRLLFSRAHSGFDCCGRCIPVVSMNLCPSLGFSRSPHQPTERFLCFCPPVIGGEPSYSPTCTCFRIPVALLTVNRTIHEEAMDVLFGENRFVLEFGGKLHSRSDNRHEEDPNKIQPIGFLRNLSSTARGRLRRITLALPYVQYFYTGLLNPENDPRNPPPAKIAAKHLAEEADFFYSEFLPDFDAGENHAFELWHWRETVRYLAECADFNNLDLAVDGTGMLHEKLVQVRRQFEREDPRTNAEMFDSWLRMLLQYDLVAAARPIEKFFGADGGGGGGGGGRSRVRQFRAFWPALHWLEDQIEAKVNGTPKLTALSESGSQPAALLSAERVENFEDGDEVADWMKLPPSERNPWFPTRRFLRSSPFFYSMEF